MNDEPIDVDVIDVSSLPPGAVAAFGDSALGHAIQRALAAGSRKRGVSTGEPIAVHDSHV